MVTRAISFFLFTFVNCVVGEKINDNEGQREGLKWPPNFYTQSEKIDLNSGLVVSAEIWFNSEKKEATTAFYGKSVIKKYSWSKRTAYSNVRIRKYVPIHNDHREGLDYMCVERVSNMTVSFLPALQYRDYIYQGKEKLGRRTVDVWKYEFEIGRAFIILLYSYKAEEYDIPVRSVTKVFIRGQTLLMVTNYHSFKLKGYKQPPTSSYNGSCIVRYSGAEVLKTEPSVDHVFQSYKINHSKKYDSEIEHVTRKAIFEENLRMIEHHNSQNLSYKMGLNQFADRTSEEMANLLGHLPGPALAGTHPFPHSDEELKTLAEELPETFDLRKEGILTPVKNQGSCGSCWAYAATAAVEGALAKKIGRLVDLSEQAVVDCSWSFTVPLALGCDGGQSRAAFRFMVKHGSPMEEEYPYLDQDGFCHTTNMTTFRILGYAIPTPLNPLAVKVALHKYGPVVVSINFTRKMGFYASGIFSDPDCNREGATINHEVAIVGYGVRGDEDYWVLKNSHGTIWGQAGYMLISAKDNHCFVLSTPVYPIV